MSSPVKFVLEDHQLHAGNTGKSKNVCICAVIFPFDAEYFMKAPLAIPLQAVELTMIGHPYFASVDDNRDTDCIEVLDLERHQDIATNKRTTLKHFPKRGACIPDPVLDFPNVHSQTGGY